MRNIAALALLPVFVLAGCASGGREKVEWQRVVLEKDGHTLEIHVDRWDHEPCGPFEARAEEFDDRVIASVYLSGRALAEGDEASQPPVCDDVAALVLDAPLGDRDVIDGATGDRPRMLERARAPVFDVVPRGFECAPAEPTPGESGWWHINCNRGAASDDWQLTMVQGLGPHMITSGTPIELLEMHGTTAALYENVAWIHTVHWTEGEWAVSVTGSVPASHDARFTHDDELKRAAAGVRVTCFGC